MTQKVSRKKKNGEREIIRIDADGTHSFPPSKGGENTGDVRCLGYVADKRGRVFQLFNANGKVERFEVDGSEIAELAKFMLPAAVWDAILAYGDCFDKCVLEVTPAQWQRMIDYDARTA
jgi:hypothetical protein